MLLVCSTELANRWFRNIICSPVRTIALRHHCCDPSKVGASAINVARPFLFASPTFDGLQRWCGLSKIRPTAMFSWSLWPMDSHPAVKRELLQIAL